MNLEELARDAREALDRQAACGRHNFIPTQSKIYDGIASWVCVHCGLRISGRREDPKSSFLEDR